MMRIHFKDPKLTDGLIKVSLDGGYTFNEHNINDVKADGILLDESQDFDKIIVKGPANVLKNLDVLSKIQIDGDSIGNTGSSAEPVQEYYTNTKFYAWKSDNQGIIYTTVLTDIHLTNLYIQDTQTPPHRLYENGIPPKGDEWAFNEDTLVESIYTGHWSDTIYNRSPEDDIIEQFKKNAPIYVNNANLELDHVTSEPEETYDSVDDGSRTTHLIINYDYLASLFNITDGRTIYFKVQHPYKGTSNEFANNSVTYFYKINPGEIRYISYGYNSNSKDGTYLFIKNWDYEPMPGENPNHIERVFTVNGEVALPEPIPSVVDPRYEKPVEDVNPSLSQKTDFTVSDPGNNPPWDLVTTIQPNLETIIVQDGITEIPENFFYKEGGLTVNKIVLPKTITGILSKAFKGCTTTIEYAGSPNMWNAIDRVDDWDEDADINITYLMVDAVAPAPNM